MIIAKRTSTMQKFDPIPAGTYMARLYSIVELGTVEFEYLGEKKFPYKVRLTFELPTEMKEFKVGEGEKPTVLSQEYTLSMHEKANLRKLIENWSGQRFTDDEAYMFDLEKLIGTPALISVVHSEKNGNVYANIASVSALPRGMVCPPAVNPPLIFSFDHWNEEAFQALPEFLQEKIQKSPEYEGHLMAVTADANRATGTVADAPIVTHGTDTDLDSLPF